MATAKKKKKTVKKKKKVGFFGRAKKNIRDFGRQASKLPGVKGALAFRGRHKLGFKRAGLVTGALAAGAAGYKLARRNHR